MNEVKKLAFEVFEERKSTKQQLAEREAKVKMDIVEKNVKDILNVFKTSNCSEASRVLICQIKLCNLCIEKHVFATIACEPNDEAQFYNWEYFKDLSLGNNAENMAAVQAIQIPKEFFEEVFKYFRDVLSEYFETSMPDAEHIIIKIKQ